MMESFAQFLTGASMKPSSYAWVRNFLGLMPLRLSCSNACWMSDAAWTEWKNYSLPSYDYAEWPVVSTTPYVPPSMIFGMKLLFASDRVLSVTSSPALKNVRRLRISKSLTSDALNVELGSAPVSAMRRWNRFDYACAGSRMFGKTSRRSSRSASLSQAWTAEDADPLRDVRDWVKYMKEESHGMHVPVPESIWPPGTLQRLS